jgi:hypothetical protein
LHENVTISYRGARYEIGRGPGFYGIWNVGGPRSQPCEWWHETPEGWQGAWARFTWIEAPGTIVPVDQASAPAADTTRRSILAAALLAVGVACGIAGLFPGYLGGSSLASSASELVPHLIYLAAWTAGAVLIALGGARLRAGALLAIGTSAVTFGLFFADLGTVIATSSRLLGAGLILSLIGWLACAAGATLAFVLRRAGSPARPPRQATTILTLILAAAGAVGAAIAFAPSWDSYTLRTPSGLSQTVTAGNAFSNPGPVIAGDVVVMIAIVAVALAAGWWRPARQGAALLAGALIPLLAQGISALVALGQGTSPAQFGITPQQAGQVGLTISSGLTAAFWLYGAFVIALGVTCAWMLMPPAPIPATAAPPGVPPASSGTDATTAAPPPGSSPAGSPPAGGSPAGGSPAGGSSAGGSSAGGPSAEGPSAIGTASSPGDPAIANLPAAPAGA